MTDKTAPHDNGAFEASLPPEFRLKPGMWVLVDKEKDEWAYFQKTSFRRHGEPMLKVIDY